MSRGKVIFLLFLSIVFVAMGVFLITKSPQSYVGYLCAGFFGLGLPIFLWRLVQPTRLEISPRGVSWFTGNRTLDFAWKDFAGFCAYRPAPRATSKHLGFEYAPNRPRRSRAAAVARAMTGVDGSFGGQWEMPAQDLADLLNQAKRKWG